jgi:DNA-binding transcriptional MerR regulator
MRVSVKDIAEMSGLHPHTIRSWADKGLIDSRRDFHNWRVFSNPVKVMAQIQGLLNGETVPEKKQKPTRASSRLRRIESNAI